MKATENALSRGARAEARRMVADATRAPRRLPSVDGPPDATLELPAGGGRVEHAITVPSLPGADALDVTQAAVSLTGVPVDAPWVTVSHSSGKVAEIARPSPETGEALLTEIRVEGLAGTDLSLNGAVLGGTSSTPRAVRFVVSIFSGGQWSAPAAAAPAFGSPGNSSLYPSMLAGATLVFDTASRAATLAINPPLQCNRARVMLLADADENVSPTTSTRADWSATSVRARWRPTPSQVAVRLTAGTSVQDVGTLPSLDGRVALDLSGAIGAMMGAAREAGGAGATTVGLRLDAASAGKVEVRVTLAAWHRKNLMAEPAVLLRGSPVALRRVSLPGVVPRACSGVLHGLWGPARLVANADRDDPSARAGVAIAAARRMARWVPLTTLERERRLLRFGVYARALEPAELLLAAHGGAPGVVGRMIGRPAAASIDPGREPSWIRADLTEVAPSEREGVWVVAWVSRGAVQLYGRDGTCQISSDAGETWSVASSLPLVQAHYDAGTDPLSPLELRAGTTVVDANLRARGQVDPRGMRIDLAPVLGADALRAAVDASGVFTLDLSCDQDIDLTPSDLALLYDPWRLGGV